MERLRHNHAEDTSELLSAYVDSALDGSEQRRAEALVQVCPGCDQEVRELRMFKTLLHDLPTLQPRRSFTLDPATAIGPRRLLFPTLRLATLVASLLFFVVVGMDALTLGSASPSAPSAAGGSQVAQNAPAASDAQAFRYGPSGVAPESAGLAAASAAASTAPAPGAAAAGGAAAANPAAQAGADLPAPVAPAAPGVGVAPLPTQIATQPEASAEAQTMAGATAVPSASDAPAPPVVAEGQADALSADQAESSAAPSIASSQLLSPDTMSVERRDTSADGSAARRALRIAELGLGLIALALGAGAVWAWRQQR